MSRRIEPNRPPEIADCGHQRSRYAVLAVCGFLLLAVGLVFGQTVSHEFVNLDDNVYVYENPHLCTALTADGIGWAFTARHAALGSR